MADRKATKGELAKPIRSGNRKAGVTKSGAPRAGRVAKPTKAERRGGNVVGGATLAGDESYVKKSTDKDLISSTIPKENRVPQLAGSGPGRSSGLSDDAQTLGTAVTRAGAMADSGVNFDEISEIKDTGVSVLGPKKARSSKQVAESKRAAKVNQGRTRSAVIAGVQSGRIATDNRSAETRQRFFTDDEDQSQEAKDIAAVTGKKVPAIQSKIRTADPTKGFVITGRDPVTKKLISKNVPRTNSLGDTRSLDKSVDKATKRNKNQAVEALGAAESISLIDEMRQGKGSTGKGAPLPGMSKSAIQDQSTALTQSDVGKPIERVEISGGSTSAIGGKVEATVRTVQTALNRDEVLSKMSTEDKREVPKLATDAIRGAPSRSGGYIGSTVGSSEITPEFRANVEAAKAADSRTAIPEDVQDQQGYSLKDLLSDKPELYEDLMKRVAGSKNRRSELAIEPSSNRRSDKGKANAMSLEGNDWRERLDSHLASLPNDDARENLTKSLLAVGIRANSPISDSAEKETTINGTTVRSTVNDTFGRIASANKAISTEVAASSRRRRGSRNTNPVEAVTEQTASEAARIFAINEATDRTIAQDYMQPPSTKPSAHALAGRLKVTDPSTGQPVTGKSVMGVVGKMPLNAAGAASPTDADLKILQATQPRLAAAFDRRPGEPGAVSITTASGDVGSIPVRANDGVVSEDNPRGLGTVTGSIAYPKAAPIPGSLSVQFPTPGGLQTGRVVPQDTPTSSTISAMTTREPSGRTPWNTLAGGSQTAVNDGSDGTTSVVRGRRSRFGDIQGSGGVPATPQNLRRAAARPYRQTGIDAAKPVAELARRTRLDLAGAPGVEKRKNEDLARNTAYEMNVSTNSPERQAAVSMIAANKAKAIADIKNAPPAEGLAPKTVPTVQGSRERPNYSKAERDQMAEQARTRRDTVAASMGRRDSQADASDAALAAGVSPFAPKPPKSPAMGGSQFNQ